MISNNKQYKISVSPSHLIILHYYLFYVGILLSTFFIPSVILDFGSFELDIDHLKMIARLFICFCALYSFLKIHCIRYQVSNERLIILSGIFTRKREEVELYRVKDYSGSSPFLLRPFGLGYVRLDTSDKTTPEVLLRGIKDPFGTADTIRDQVEKQREIKGVREFD